MGFSRQDATEGAAIHGRAGHRRSIAATFNYRVCPRACTPGIQVFGVIDQTRSLWIKNFSETEVRLCAHPSAGRRLGVALVSGCRPPTARFLELRWPLCPIRSDRRLVGTQTGRDSYDDATW